MSSTRHSADVGAFDAIVVVGSQGALESFQAMVRSLSEGFPAAVVFDLHRADSHGVTEELLRRRCSLPVGLAEDRLELRPGRVYLAPHHRQLLISEGLRMSVRPSAGGTGHPFADALLESAAGVLGPRLIAVVLSGRLDGGARGVREVKRRGGRVLVQDPRTAVAPAMPTGALATGCVDFALAPERLGDVLLALCAAAGAAELFRVRINVGVSG